MNTRLTLVAVGAALAVCLGAASSAAAATQVGVPCIANRSAESEQTLTIFQTSDPQGPFPVAVPAAGVITSWGVNVGGALAPGASTLVGFRVVRPDQMTKTVQVIGESSGTVTAGSNSFDTRIPVQPGDLVASTNETKTFLVCEEPSPGSSFGVAEGSPTTGSTFPLFEQPETKGRIPIFATVEPDADGDGYGDETQDKCPTDASTHDACPSPQMPPAAPAPITLSATAVAKKNLVVVSLTSGAQASVTVSGTVKLGKGKTVKLSGGTQLVAPPTLAKFTLLFPAKLKAALKQLSSRKKLVLNLTAGAPGATTTSFTAKVPGQKSAGARHHHKPGA